MGKKCYAHIGLNCDCDSCNSLTQSEFEEQKQKEDMNYELIEEKFFD